MSKLSTIYRFNEKSTLLKFIDKRNNNFYKLVNGKTYTLISSQNKEMITEKTSQLNGCKKVITLIKCVVCLPLLAVTLILKLASKENKLAAARFKRIQLAEKNDKRADSSSISELVVPSKSSSSTNIPSVVSEVEENRIKSDSEALKNEDVKIFLSASDIMNAQALQDAAADKNVWDRITSFLQTSKLESSTEFITAKSGSSTIKSESLLPSQTQEVPKKNTYTAYWTNTVAPAAIKGVYSVMGWAANQIIKDGLIYAASAATGIPPSDFKLGLQNQVVADKYF